MIYFAYMPKTTIADILPVLIAGFDKNFVKPCMPNIAPDGSLYYTHHEDYVTGATNNNPLSFRSLDWSMQFDYIKKLSQQNVFVGNYNDHTKLLKSVNSVTINVSVKPQYLDLIIAQALMFNNHHKKNQIKDFNNLLTEDKPADISIDLLDLYDINFVSKMLDSLHIEFNKEKQNFYKSWLDKLAHNSVYFNCVRKLNQIDK